MSPHTFSLTGSLYGLLGTLGTLLWIAMLVDFVIRRPGWYWLVLLLLMPGFGAILYLFVVFLPELQAPNGLLKFWNRRQRLHKLEAQAALNPSVGAQHELADALLENGKAEPARAIYEKLVPRAGDDPYLRHGLALALMQTGRPDAALEHLDWIAANFPRHRMGQALVDRGNALADLGRKPEAIAAYQAALGQISSTEARVRLAQLLAETGQVEQGRELARTVLHEYRNSPRYQQRAERKWWLLAKAIAR